MKSIKGSSVLFALLLTVLSFFIAITCFEILWWTNDDSAMSMIAHGYAAFDLSSSKLIFSNIVWGYIVTSIPSFFGVSGYALGGGILLFFCFWGLLYALLKAHLSWYLAYGLTLVIMIRPVLFPQFTLLAGMLAVSSISFLYLYIKLNRLLHLAIFVFLFFCACLVREREALFVVLVALPMLPWRGVIKDKWIYVAAIVFCVMLGLAKFFEQRAYSGSEWDQFKEFQSIRSQLIDYGGLVHLAKRPDIYEKYDYSLNDLKVLQRWFFADEEIADIQTLKLMLADLGPIYAQGSWLSSIKSAMNTFVRGEVVLFFFACLLMLVLKLSVRSIVSWSVFFVLIFYLAVIGRPGVLRVYLPAMSLLFLVPVFISPMFERTSKLELKWLGWRRAAQLVLIVLCVAYCLSIMNQSNRRAIAANEHRLVLEQLPENETVVIAPNAYYSNFLYPVLGGHGFNRNLRLEVFGWSYFMPSSVASVEAKKNNGFVQRLFSSEGVLYMEGDFLPYLDVYCQERGRERQIIDSKGIVVYPEILRSKVLRVRCL